MKRIHTTLILVPVLLAGALGGCEPVTPQERVAALVEEAESAVEDRKPARLRPLLAEDFIGPDSMDREAVIAIARRYLLIHHKVHTITNIVHVAGGETPGEHIEAVVYAAMAGQRIESLDALSGIDAKIMRFELILKPDEDGSDARVTEAEWTPATVKDMLLARWRDAH